MPLQLTIDAIQCIVYIDKMEMMQAINHKAVF